MSALSGRQGAADVVVVAVVVLVVLVVIVVLVDGVDIVVEPVAVVAAEVGVRKEVVAASRSAFRQCLLETPGSMQAHKHTPRQPVEGSTSRYCCCTKELLAQNTGHFLANLGTGQTCFGGVASLVDGADDGVS